VYYQLVDDAKILLMEAIMQDIVVYIFKTPHK